MRLTFVRRAESRTQQVRPLDPAVVSDDAKEVLLDDVRLALLDAREAVGDVKAVADLGCPRV